MAGADIAGFLGASADVVGGLAAKVIEVFAVWSACVPVVALVDGVALGGGNELAMSAHYRIVTENALFGQPEIKLGHHARLRRHAAPAPVSSVGLAQGGRTRPERRADRRPSRCGGRAGGCVLPEASALRLAFNTALRIAAGEIELPRRDWDRLAAPPSRASLGRTTRC